MKIADVENDSSLKAAVDGVLDTIKQMPNVGGALLLQVAEVHQVVQILVVDELDHGLAGGDVVTALSHRDAVGVAAPLFSTFNVKTKQSK